MAPQKALSHDVFTVFQNGGAWPSQGMSFFVGLIGTVFAMFGKPFFRQTTLHECQGANSSLGCDAAVHVSRVGERTTLTVNNIPRWPRKSETQTLPCPGQC